MVRIFAYPGANAADVSTLTPALGIGVVGLGVIAPYYLAALERSPRASLRAACDIDSARLAGLSGRAMVTTDLHELLERDDVDAVVVNVPNDRHHEVCSAALRAGKHVCCEKPLAPDPGEARELTALADDRDLVLFTSFHRRYNENVRRLAAAARDVDWAELEYLERIEEHAGDDSWYLDPARCGGGCLADNGPNAFDTLDLLLGTPRVTGARVERDARGVDLRAEVTLECGEAGTPARVLLDWSYPFGERKQVTLGLPGDALARADMLAGWEGFKESLVHEYEGVLADFADAIATGERRGGDGAAIAQLVADAYAAAEGGPATAAAATPRDEAPKPAGDPGPVPLRPGEPEPPGDKATVAGRFVKLLHHARHDRGMRLIPEESRCVRAGEVHEIVTTDQSDARPGERIDRVGFLGFAELADPGVIARGDRVRIGDTEIGRVAGFDDAHFPNHYNVLIAVPELVTATEVSLNLDDAIEFRGDA